jgi:hypothetical protein
LGTSEPFGSALWPNLLRYRTFAIGNVGCMSDSGADSATRRLQFLGDMKIKGNYSVISHQSSVISHQLKVYSLQFTVRADYNREPVTGNW